MTTNKTKGLKIFLEKNELNNINVRKFKKEKNSENTIF